jgi:hypothetical protein
MCGVRDVRNWHWHWCWHWCWRSDHVSGRWIASTNYHDLRPSKEELSGSGVDRNWLSHHDMVRPISARNNNVRRITVITVVSHLIFADRCSNESITIKQN